MPLLKKVSNIEFVENLHQFGFNNKNLPQKTTWHIFGIPVFTRNISIHYYKNLKYISDVENKKLIILD